MTFLDGTEQSTHRHHRGAVHVPADGGETRWFGHDVYTMKLLAGQTNGAIGFVEASVPPGGGSVAHTHDEQSETFYLLSGELEFLDGERTFTARTGDIVFVPPNTRHRFHNAGLMPARLLFFYTPAGGSEEVFLHHGDPAERDVHQEPWGQERFTEELMAAFEASGTHFHP